MKYFPWSGRLIDEMAAFHGMQEKKQARMRLVERQMNAPLSDVLYQAHQVDDLMHRQISRVLGVPRPTLTRWFHELGVPTQPCHRYTVRNLSSWKYKMGILKKKPRYEGPDRRIQRTRKGVNVDFFKQWSSEMAYVLGYFAADGCLSINPRGSRYVEFVSADNDLLCQIKALLGATQVVSKKTLGTPRQRATYRLQVGAREVYEDLVRLGFGRRKEYRLKLPLVPARYTGAFVRGYFDGDGCVSFGAYRRKNRPRYVKVVITSFASGSIGFLKQLWAYLKRHAGLQGGCLHKRKWGAHLQFSRTNSLQLFHFMYNTIDNNQPYLRRKYRKFLRALRFIQKGP